jgi:hypothetical protein
MFLLSYANDALGLKQTELGSTSTGYLPSRRCFTGTTSLNHLGLQSCTRGTHETPLISPQSMKQHANQVESPFKIYSSANIHRIVNLNVKALLSKLMEFHCKR